jgi:hypothetical protein
MDTICEFSDGQDLSSLNGSSVLSTDVINLGDADLDIGAGTPVFLNIKIGTAIATATSVQFQLYAHTTATVNSGTAVWDSGAIVIANLTAGTEVANFSLPVNVDDAGQFIGLYYTAVGNVTAGTVDAWLSLTPGAEATSTQVRSSNI